MSFFKQWVQERDGLDGFSQTHLISQNSVDTIGPRVPQPIKTFNPKYAYKAS